MLCNKSENCNTWEGAFVSVELCSESENCYAMKNVYPIICLARVFWFSRRLFNFKSDGWVTQYLMAIINPLYLGLNPLAMMCIRHNFTNPWIWIELGDLVTWNFHSYEIMANRHQPLGDGWELILQNSSRASFVLENNSATMSQAVIGVLASWMYSKISVLSSSTRTWPFWPQFAIYVEPLCTLLLVR